MYVLEVRLGLVIVVANRPRANFQPEDLFPDVLGLQECASTTLMAETTFLTNSARPWLRAILMLRATVHWVVGTVRKYKSGGKIYGNHEGSC